MKNPLFSLAAFLVIASSLGAQSPTTETVPDAPVLAASEAAETAPEVTPLSLPGSEPFIFRKIGTTELLLHVVKPKGWTATSKRPCLIAFFGGGWSSGTPEKSIGWSKWAAKADMVGVAPDYRTRKRFEGTPEDCVSDGRAAVRWVIEHAAELGVDPSKIICLGASAGAHVAAWTAIPGAGPGKDDPGAPEPLPAALILINPVTDTKDGGYGGSKRFGNSPERAAAASVPDRMPAKMPPTLIFHATADVTVKYQNSKDFCDKLVAAGNRCELVTFDGLGHSFYSSKYGAAGAAAKEKSQVDMGRFLASLGFMTAPQSAPGN